MKHEKSYHHDFGFVLNYVQIKKIYPDIDLKISHKITKKLRKYDHSNTNEDFKLMYVKYYLDGILHKLDFDEIVKDGVFHKFDYNICKSLFFEVYDDNPYLMKQFELKNCDYFKNNDDHSRYRRWLSDNFRKSYNKINKINTKDDEDALNMDLKS
jgi:hypothetical protein